MTNRRDKTIQKDMSGSNGTPVRLGVDIGGTFTDVTLVDADGVLHISKVLTTPKCEEQGALAAIRQIATRSVLEALMVFSPFRVAGQRDGDTGHGVHIAAVYGAVAGHVPLGAPAARVHAARQGKGVENID